MAFNWIFSPLNNSYTNIAGNIIIYIIDFLIPRLLEIIATPFMYPELLWIVLPLVVATILMILYFGRYRNEELGWNTAFGNNIALIFVSINLIQHLSENDLLFSNKAFFIYILLFYNLIQLFINYYHLVPKGVSFILNSTIPINVIHYLAILIAYSNVPVDVTTFVSSTILILLLYALSRIIWIFVPMSKGSKIFKYLQDKKAEQIRINEKRKLTRNEALEEKKDNLVFFGIISYLILYVILFIINKLFFDLSDYYLIILGVYFLIFSFFYIRKKKLNTYNLLISKTPLRRDFGVLVGVLIFFYYIILSNFFIDVFNIGTYSANIILFIITVLLTSFSSELFFRGIIQRGLKISNSKHVSVSIQALLWILLSPNLFMVSFSNILYAFISLIILYPIGLLIGYVKEEWYFDSGLSAILTVGLLSIFSLLL